jgi:hypothetical protein
VVALRAHIFRGKLGGMVALLTNFTQNRTSRRVKITDLNPAGSHKGNRLGDDCGPGRKGKHLSGCHRGGFALAITLSVDGRRSRANFTPWKSHLQSNLVPRRAVSWPVGTIRPAGGITTQGDTLAELQNMVSDAVGGYFDDGKAPARVRLHFVHDPVFAVA